MVAFYLAVLFLSIWTVSAYISIFAYRKTNYKFVRNSLNALIVFFMICFVVGVFQTYNT